MDDDDLSKRLKGLDIPDTSSILGGRELFYRPPEIDMSHVFEAQREMQRVARERIDRERTIAAAAEHSLNAASFAVDCLVDEIGAFESSLGEQEEVALFVIGGPAGQQFFPEIMKPLDPDKVLYGGRDQNGRPFTVVQHVSQLNFAMLAAVLEEGQQPRRIGVLLQ